MKSEQMELMKVIEFPQNKIEEKEGRERKDKLEVAYKMLDFLIDTGSDFNIMVDMKAADELFEISEKQMEKFKYLVLTTDYQKYKDVRIDKAVNKVAFYEIKGDEF